MLPRSLRLTKDRDIKTVIKRGQLIDTPHVRIFYYSHPQATASRLAAVVSKQVSASAVRRHQYQRWLRAAARDFLPQLARPVDLVMIARPSLSSVTSYADLEASISPHLAPILS